MGPPTLSLCCIRRTKDFNQLRRGDMFRIPVIHARRRIGRVVLPTEITLGVMSRIIDKEEVLILVGIECDGKGFDESSIVEQDPSGSIVRVHRVHHRLTEIIEGKVPQEDVGIVEDDHKGMR